LEAAQWISILK